MMTPMNDDIIGWEATTWEGSRALPSAGDSMRGEA